MMVLLIVVFLSSLVLTGIFLQYALKKSILDLPNERSSHQQPTPRGGGIVFVTVFYLFLLCMFVTNAISQSLWLSLLGGIPIAIVGYCDDVFTVKIQWRILVHMIAASWGIFWLPISHAWIVPIAIFLTVWFINLYNFMDGIDGLAASEAIFVSIVAGIAFINSDSSVSLLCFGLAFSVFGFLYWNWAPAKIFMGDIGSGFLGYFFAIMLWATVSPHKTSLFFWLILLAVFFGDATFTLLRRILQRKKWYQAHREHLYQKLVQKGLRHYQMTLLVMLVNMAILLPMALYL